MKNVFIFCIFSLLLPLMAIEPLSEKSPEAAFVDHIVPQKDIREEARNEMKKQLADYADFLANQSDFKQFFDGLPYRFVFGTSALLSSENRVVAELNTELDISLEEELPSMSSEMRLYYLALSNMNSDFTRAISPIVKRNLYHLLLNNEKPPFKPDDKTLPMTEIEEVEALDKILKLPNSRLRKVLEKVQLQPDDFFVPDDDSRFMKLAVAIDLKVQKEATSLCASIVPFRTFETQTNEGVICFGIVAVSCPSLPSPDLATSIIPPPQNADYFQIETCSWLQSPYFLQTGVRIAKNSSGQYYYLGFGQEDIPLKNEDTKPSEREMDDYENALTRAGENAKNALKIHFSAMRFFSNPENIDKLLSSYQGAGYGNYSLEHSLESCLNSLPKFLNFQNILQNDPFLLLRQREEQRDTTGKNTITVIYALPVTLP